MSRMSAACAARLRARNKTNRITDSMVADVAHALGVQRSHSCERFEKRVRKSANTARKVRALRLFVEFRYEGLIRHWGTDILAAIDCRQLDWFGCEVLIRDARKQMPDHVQPGAFLVVRVHDIPR